METGHQTDIINCISCNIELNKLNYSIPNQTFNRKICKKCDKPNLSNNCKFCDLILCDENFPKYFQHKYCNNCKKIIEKYRRSLNKKQRKPGLNNCNLNNLKTKLEVFKIFNSKCNCCGESNFSKLTIDHIKGRDINSQDYNKTGIQLYYWLLNQSISFVKENYQLLCFNCNCAKGYHGFCPHLLTKGNNCFNCKNNLNIQFDFNKRYNHNVCQNCIINFSRTTTNNKRKIYLKNQALNIKDQVINAYGGKCTNCNEAEIYFLSLDHINNDGYKDRKNYSGIGFYRKLIKNQFNQKNLQVLCFNCNCSKSLYSDIPKELIIKYNTEIYTSFDYVYLLK